MAAARETFEGSNPTDRALSTTTLFIDYARVNNLHKTK